MQTTTMPTCSPVCSVYLLLPSTEKGYIPYRTVHRLPNLYAFTIHNLSRMRGFEGETASANSAQPVCRWGCICESRELGVRVCGESNRCWQSSTFIRDSRELSCPPKYTEKRRPKYAQPHSRVASRNLEICDLLHSSLSTAQHSNQALSPLVAPNSTRLR